MRRGVSFNLYPSTAVYPRAHQVQPWPSLPQSPSSPTAQNAWPAAPLPQAQGGCTPFGGAGGGSSPLALNLYQTHAPAQEASVPCGWGAGGGGAAYGTGTGGGWGGLGLSIRAPTHYAPQLTQQELQQVTLTHEQAAAFVNSMASGPADFTALRAEEARLRQQAWHQAQVMPAWGGQQQTPVWPGLPPSPPGSPF